MANNDLLQDIREGIEESRERNPRVWELFGFVSKLLAAGLVFRAVLFLNPDTVFFQRQLASVTNLVLDLAGYSFEQQGILLVGTPDSYLISRDCLGWKSIAAFIGLVFASAYNWRKEISAIIFGALALGALNVVRIVSTVILTEAGIISFEIIHTFLWRWGMTLTVLITWYSWFTGLFDGKIR